MNSTEKDLLRALVDLDNSVKTIQTATPKPNLTEMFARIDTLAGQLPKDTDPSLQHYLKKKSYQKARFFLEGRDAENAAGNCGHVG
jgi:hypothetical protein